MRLEATISETRREQLRALQAELKLSKSQVVDEALSIFLKAYMETKRGNRLAIIDPEGRQAVQVASPALSQVEWALFSRSLKVSPAAAKKVKRMVGRPAAPTAGLRKAMTRRRRTA
ncbi:MAG: hypothetical protein ACM3PC_04005 [Deltaproteobacteria bacterium]